MEVAEHVGNRQRFDELMTARLIASCISPSHAAENFDILEIPANRPWPYVIGGSAL
jgi:hypothetical protein